MNSRRDAMKRTAPILVTLIVIMLSACGGEPSAGPRGGPPEAYADESHAAGEGEDNANRVELTPEQISSARIGIASAGPASVRERQTLYGVIAPNAERVRDVTARFPGVIRNITKRVGDTVRQGETLATVESNESLQTYVVTSPLSGVITGRNANPGENTGDKALLAVADLSTVWVELALFPRDIAEVRVGQAVRVWGADSTLNADGNVVYVAPFGSSTSQTLTARVLLDNANRRWPPGLYVTAELTLATTSVPLAVRSEALQTIEDRTVVFVQNAEGFEARTVQVGRSDGEIAEVLTGIEPGETYAAANSFILKAELGKGAAEHGH
ncbi:MAG: HlyD family efflux transporter periplasmic adaptor subunit [Gammaproteobacteria bacterium]|nr:MAG: HlyD family efflux transporter periplasmic adaptor subunit [Gammaproteobacteria bacterium]